MKIAVGGIATENSTFSVWKSGMDAFTITHGEDFEDQYPFFGDITSAFPTFEFVPIVRGRALPGGRVEKSVYDHIKGEMLDGLRGQNWDGVYLNMHGAMYVDQLEDAEGDWMQSIREVVGEDCLIAASYDLHGNVSPRVISNVDILTAYRTAPHVDVMETRERAVSLLIMCLTEGIRPYKGYVQIPVALPGEKTSTEWEPGMSLYAEIPQTLDADGVLDATITVGYAWADEPRTGATAIVLGTDENVVKREAERLAQAYWDVRGDFQFGVPVGSSDEVIQMALDAPESCVFISDSGDNPTAGGVGDVTYTLGRLIALNVPDAVYASIPNAEAVTACAEAGVGAEVTVTIGGVLDTRYSEALTITGKVLFVDDIARMEYGRQLPAQKQAVVQVGGVQVIITEKRTPFHFIRQFQDLGIEPTDHKIVVIKIGYLEPDLKRAAPKALLALSPGAVNQALEQLPYERIPRPMFPFDADMTWTPHAHILRIK